MLDHFGGRLIFSLSVVSNFFLVLSVVSYIFRRLSLAGSPIQTLFQALAKNHLASHAGVFRGARFSSLPTNACSIEDNIPFPC